MIGSDLKPIEIAAQDGTATAAMSAIKNLKDVKGAADELTGAMGRLSSEGGSATAAFESAFAKLAGRLAGGALAVGLFATIKAARDQYAELGDRAEDLRLPAQYLKEQELAAAQARVPLEKLNAAHEHFAGVSKKSKEEAQDFFTALGNIDQAAVKAFQSAGSQIERQRIVGDAYRSTTDEVKRAQLGLQAYGTDSERTLAVVAAGTAELEAFRAKALELGVVIDEAMIRKAQESQANMNVLATVIRDRVVIGVNEFYQGAAQLAGGIKDVADSVGFALPQFQSWKELLAGTRTELANLTAWAEIAAAAIKHPFDEAARSAAIAAALAKRELHDLRESTLAADAGLNDIGRPLHTGTARPAFRPRPLLNADTGGGEDAFGRAESQIRKRIALTDAETSTIGLNTAARERARVVAELEEAAKRANTAAGLKNTEVTEEQRASIERLADAMQAATERLRGSKTAWEGINESARYFGNVAGEAFDTLMDKTKSWQDFTISAARNVARELIRAALTGEGAFAKVLGLASSSGGTGGIFGALASAIGGGGSAVPGAAMVVGAAGSMAVPTFAGGGTIPPFGLGLVSEHKSPRFVRAGAEPLMVTPGEPGGGALNFTYAPTINGGGNAADIRAELMASEARVRASIVPAVKDAIRRKAL